MSSVLPQQTFLNLPAWHASSFPQPLGVGLFSKEKQGQGFLNRADYSDGINPVTKSS